MLVYTKDLSHLKGYSNLPSQFRGLGRDDFFTFYYAVNYAETTLKIKVAKIRNLTDVSVFVASNVERTEDGDMEKFGYFKQPFNTKDALFYYFLRTYLGNEAKEFVLECKEKDEEKLKNEKPLYAGDYEVVDRISYESALGQFILFGNLINPLMAISDSVNTYLKAKHGKSLYGETINRFVRMVKHSASSKEKGKRFDLFVVPYANGEMRYLIVGENSELLKNDKSLVLAKQMLREKYSHERIFLDTKWFYNKMDGKFRRYVSDISTGIHDGKLVRAGNNLIYMPKDCPFTIDDINKNLALNPSTNKWQEYVDGGYNGILGDILDHPEIYKHYPSLYSKHFFYIKKFGDVDRNNNYAYYFSPNMDGIVICGHSTQLTSVLLHETQHAIQQIEGFAEGGNTSISKSLALFNSGETREYIILQKVLDKELKSFSDIKVNEIRRRFVPFYTATTALMKDFLQGGVRSPKITKIMSVTYQVLQEMNSLNVFKDFSNKCGSLLYGIGLIYSDLKILLQKNNNFQQIELLDALIKSMFENPDNFISYARYSSQSFNFSEAMALQGYGADQAERINFYAYESIAGEVEARTVQNIAFLEQELLDYFAPYSTEAPSFSAITVTYGRGDETLDETTILAAIEKDLNGKYIFHLNGITSCVPFLHELGHLIYDVLAENGLAQFVNLAYLKQSSKYRNAEEYFCDYFCAYLLKSNFNDDLSADLSIFANIEFSDDIDAVLNSVFIPATDSLIGEKYLSYLKQLAA